MSVYYLMMYSKNVINSNYSVTIKIRKPTKTKSHVQFKSHLKYSFSSASVAQ